MAERESVRGGEFDPPCRAAQALRLAMRARCVGGRLLDSLLYDDGGWLVKAVKSQRAKERVVGNLDMNVQWPQAKIRDRPS